MCGHTLPHKENPRKGSILHLPSHHNCACIEEFIKQPIKYYSEKSLKRVSNIVYYFQYFLYGFNTFAWDVLLRILDYKQLDAFQS